MLVVLLEFSIVHFLIKEVEESVVSGAAILAWAIAEKYAVFELLDERFLEVGHQFIEITEYLLRPRLWSQRGPAFHIRQHLMRIKIQNALARL